mmetsp:Transcript_15530/g.43454  ORF Transcript_15530/g.43454 Transcript_15530/m.43454 type:complete len:235 (-) Transcript_15530:1091-1795(-)
MISMRPRRLGSGRWMMRSKRPGRVRAVSREAGRLVAAITTTPVLSSKPSISVRSWLMVCTLSSLPPISPPKERCLPRPSNSSMKRMHGEFFLAFSNISRTREAPTPTNISMNSVPLALKNGTPASPAIAFARRVLPVPGGPTRSTPAGDRAPRSKNRLGLRRKATTSWISALTWSMPATSSKVVDMAVFFIISMRTPPNSLSRFCLRPRRKENLTKYIASHTGKARRSSATTTV